MRRRLDPGQPIRVGLVGHGDAGRFIHGPLIEAADDYRIVGVSTSRPETLEARWDRPRWAPDANALVAAEDVDLVVVATPNDTHYRYARAALEAGKSVLIEKPFVTHPQMAEDLIALADRRGVCLSVFHNRRLDADLQLVRRMIASGALGEPSAFEARWDRPLEEAATGWRARTAAGGGVHWDLGSHLVDQTLQLFGDQPVVRGGIGRSSNREIAPGRFDLDLRYGRLTCRLSAGVTSAPPRPRFTVRGARGTLTIEAAEPWGYAIGRGRHPARPGFWDDVPVQTARLTLDGVSRPLQAGYPNWDRFYPRLAAVLRGAAEPDVTGAQAARVVKILHSLEAGPPP